MEPNRFNYSKTAIKWGADLPSRESESSESRITELFNVNFFILSEATPFLAPFIATDLRNTQVTLSTKYVKFIGAELKYRVKQIGQWGLIPNWIVAIFDQKIQADITIAPELKSEDFSTIFSNPTYSTIPYWTLKGEKSTWPLISMIKKCLDVENKLYDVSVQLKAELDRSVKDQADAPLLTVNNKRTRSFA